MPTPRLSILASFHQFVGEQLASENAAQMSPELAVALWREREETLAAIREGLADVEAGRTFPADEIIRELRAKLHDACAGRLNLKRDIHEIQAWIKSRSAQGAATWLAALEQSIAHLSQFAASSSSAAEADELAIVC